jgi:hypothetical protein
MTLLFFLNRGKNGLWVFQRLFFLRGNRLTYYVTIIGANGPTDQSKSSEER